jgi:hypothetical protein
MESVGGFGLLYLLGVFGGVIAAVYLVSVRRRGR